MSVRWDAGADKLNTGANLGSPTGYTLYLRAKLVNVLAGTNRPVFWLADASVSGYHILRFDTTDNLAINTAPAGATTNVIATPAGGVWFSVFMQCQGTGATDLRIGFKLDTDRDWTLLSVPGTTFTPADLVVGGVNGSNWTDWEGADFRQWDAFLSIAELNAELTQRTPRRTANLRRDLRLASGATAGTDSSGNGFNLTAATLSDGASEPTALLLPLHRPPDPLPPPRLRSPVPLLAAAFTAGALLMPSGVVQPPLNTSMVFDSPVRRAFQTANLGYLGQMPTTLQPPAVVQPPLNTAMVFDLPPRPLWKVDSRGFTQSTDLTLLGLDQQFRDPGQWTSYDYPNPRGPRRPPVQYEFTNTLLLATLPIVQPPLNTAMVFDNPVARKWNVTQRGYTLSSPIVLTTPPVVIQPPLNTAMVFDLPPARKWSIDARGYTQEVNLALLVPVVTGPLPLNQYNWPLPVRKPVPLPGYVFRGNAFGVAPITALPRNQSDWPLPVRRPATLPPFVTHRGNALGTPPPGGFQIDASPSVSINTPYGMTAIYSDGAQRFYTSQQKISGPNKFFGRITAGAGIPEELSGTQATALLDAFTTTLKGVVPGSGGGTTNFLRADGAWAAPPSGGSLANPTASIGLTANNGVATTGMRSDASPPLSQAIAPTWTGKHVFAGLADITTVGSGYATIGTLTAGAFPGVNFYAVGPAANARRWGMYVDETAGTLTLATFNDAGVFGTNLLAAARTTTQVTTITVGDSNAILASAASVYFTASLPAPSLAGNALNLGAGKLKWIASGGATNAKVWEFTSNTTQFNLRTVDDSDVSVRNALNFTRSGLALTLMEYGNTTDYSPHNFYGDLVITNVASSYVNIVRSSLAIGQVGIRFGGGSSSVDWYQYMQTSQNGLNFYTAGVGDVLTLGADGRLIAGFIHNNAGGVAGTTPMLASGTYAPTAVLGGNVSSVTADTAQYLRCGNSITVSGRLSVTVSGVGTALFKLPVPTASSFNAVGQAAGYGASASSAWIITADIASGTPLFTWPSSSLGTHIVLYSFTYLVR